VNEVEDKIDQVLRFHASSSPPVPTPADMVTAIPMQPQHVSGACLPGSDPTEPAGTRILADPLASFSLPTKTVSRDDIPWKNLAIARLGEEDFPYDKSTLRGPPLIHFSGDIERLCHEWKSSNLLTVNGHGIPIKYWGEFFKKSKGRALSHSAWDSIKVEWGNWKVCCEKNLCLVGF